MGLLLLLILKAAYFMLPAYIANMFPVFVKKLKFLDYPMDFGLKVRGKRFFGKNKTFRGLFFGTIIGAATAYLQLYLLRFEFFSSLAIIDYSNWLLVGILLGFGAIIGDAIESFFKRQLGIAPGDRLLIGDQTDFVFGALLFVSLVFVPPLEIMVVSVVITFFLHIASVRIAFWTGLRNEKW